MLFQREFKGQKFFISVLGTKRPVHVMRSFDLEQDVRNKWWNIQSNDCVLDIGAGFGSYTLTALALGANVLAVEPNPDEMFNLLTSLNSNNDYGFIDRCRLVNSLVGEGPCIAEYFPGTHSVRDDSKEAQTIMCVTLDYLVDVYLKGIVDWIKIDVEGMEASVLKGAEKTLRTKKSKVIIELHEGILPGVCEQVFKAMSGFGYYCKDQITGGGANEHWVLWESSK